MTHPQVTIEQGILRGSVGTDIGGNTFFKFQGIPYAKPPLGELRFKAPVPPETWTGIFDATKEGDVCYSVDPLKRGQVEGSENCLVLNVYTKSIEELRPVLFWIHGGAFVFGHGGEELYAPDFLMTEDVVVVSINYRLGMLGFLSLDDPSLDIPGNAGLKDQVMALKWVQKNISAFGGDPNNVTIFGESAGGRAVHLHVLSPMSKGLFHRAIAQSGCLPFVKRRTDTKKLAEVMNLDEGNIYNELMKKSKEEILQIQGKISGLMVPSEVQYLRPVVERNSKEAFLPDDPINIIRSGNINQVPFMVGFTTAEGMLYELFKSRVPKVFSFEQMVPLYFGYENEAKEVAQKIKKFYFGDEDPSESNINKKYDLLTDVNFLFGIYVTIVTHLPISKAPIYLYRMSVETELNFLKKILQIKTPGVSHCDDLGYLFKHFATPPVEAGSVEDICRARFVKLWTNFAKFGNPTPDKNDALLKAVWKPVTDSKLDFLDIGKELVPMTHPEAERINFWKKLFAESPAGRKLNLNI